MLNIPQNEHFPVLLSQRLKPFSQSFAQLFSLERLRRHSSPIGKVLRQIISFVIGPRLLDGLVQVSTVFSDLQTRFVDRDLDDPGAEFRLAPEIRQVCESL